MSRRAGDIHIGPGRFGRGLFAGRDFRRGETLFVFTGRKISLVEAIAKENKEGDALQTGPATYLDLDLPGLLANHSCEPNAGVQGGRKARALRDIARGEEIFYDYSTTMSERRWTMDCQCGTSSCRGIIGDFHDLPPSVRRHYLRLGVVQPFIIKECEQIETGRRAGSRGLQTLRGNTLASRALSLVVPGALALLSTGLAATAPDVTDLSLEKLLRVDVPSVTGVSKFEQKSTDAPASVTVITAEDIKNYGYSSLADILQSVAGLSVTSDGTYSYAGVRGFNRPGDYNGRVLLLIDGHRTNDNIFGSALLGTEQVLDVDLIDRVEVIRGASSSLYGTSAFFGVINVITRRPADFHAGETSVSVASVETGRARLTLAHHFANGFSFLLSGSLLESDGDERLHFREFDNAATNHGIAENLDHDRSKQLFLKLGYGDFTLEGLYSRREKGLPNGAYDTLFNDPGARQIDQLSYLELKYEHDFDGWQVEARASVNSYHYLGYFPHDNYLPEDPAQVVINQDDVEGEWFRSEVQVSHLFLEKHRFTLGIDFQNNYKQDQKNFDISPSAVYGDSRRDSSETGIFAQDEFRIFQALTLNAGLRYDWYDQFGGTVNPRIALIYEPCKTTTLKALYGRAFRAPNAFEAYYQSVDGQANPMLQPEHIESYELVLDQELTPRLRLAASAYLNQIEDIISLQTDATGAGFYSNADSAKSHGIELELDGKWAGGISTRISYAWQNTGSESTGHELSNSPTHLAKANILIPFWNDQAALGLEVQYTGPVQSVSNQQVDGFWLVNATLCSHHLAKNIEVSLSVANLLDEHYRFPVSSDFPEDSIEARGRQLRLKATCSF